MSFPSLDLGAEILRAISGPGFDTPTYGIHNAVPRPVNHRERESH